MISQQIKTRHEKFKKYDANTKMSMGGLKKTSTQVVGYKDEV